MRKLMTALVAAAACGAWAIPEAGAQTAQDTIGRVLQGLQGSPDQRSQDQRPGYREDDRRRGEFDSRDRDTDRRRDGRGYGEDRRPSAAESRLNERERRL